MKAGKWLSVLLTTVGLAMMGVPAMAQSHITVATDPTFPPMEMLDHGVIEGLDVDIMTEAAAAAGMSASFENVPWDEIFANLQAGNVDAIASGVTVLEWRKSTMDFSVPYFSCPQAIVTRRGSPKVQTLEGLRGKAVGMLEGSRTASEISNNPQTYGVTPRFYTDFDTMYKDLVAKSIEALIADTFSAEAWTRDIHFSQTIEIGGASTIPEDYAFAVKKGNTALLEKINYGIKSIRESGRLAELQSKWVH